MLPLLRRERPGHSIFTRLVKAWLESVRMDDRGTYDPNIRTAGTTVRCEVTAGEIERGYPTRRPRQGRKRGIRLGTFAQNSSYSRP